MSTATELADRLDEWVEEYPVEIVKWPKDLAEANLLVTAAAELRRLDAEIERLGDQFMRQHAAHVRMTAHADALAAQLTAIRAVVDAEEPWPEPWATTIRRLLDGETERAQEATE